MESCRRVLIALFCLFCFTVVGQQDNKKLTDELLNIVIKTRDSKTDSARNINSKQLIKISKDNKREDLLIYGYHMQALSHNDLVKIKYCDSVIALTEFKTHPYYPMEVFLIKANYYFEKYDYPKALDSYINVLDYAKKSNNRDYLIKATYDIADIKRIIGEPQQALPLYRQVYDSSKKLEKAADSSNLIWSLIAIANIHGDLKNGDSASYYNRRAHKVAVENKYEFGVKYTAMSQGVALYHLSRYQEAIDSLEKYSPYFESKYDINNLTYSYHYCGLAYKKLGNIAKSIKYFQKVDSLFIVNQKAFALMREPYEELITYYRDKNNLELELKYVDQLIKLNNQLLNEEIYIRKNLSNKYDLPKLEEEKQSILKQINRNKNFYGLIIIGIVIILIVLIIFSVIQLRRKKQYRNKFNEILKVLNQKELSDSKIHEDIPELEVITELEKSKTKSLNISSNIIETILNQLGSFEEEYKFLNSDISLNSLAKEFNTNGNYLSKIINRYKGDSFTNYLSKLRIQYFIKSIKEDKSLRKFTIKALAAEVGFSNAESFSKAFYKYKGIKPSYFLRELNKIQK
ncbi:AraC family transcriptional regulator [uncultured Nonlabens sp.]|uniref:AraC family transcriptional regulator n=1 Tax=uncultured Nonlabens sp. TaxID=859306 RepID=UPI0026197DEF|nr:AraC family transcriptional regulator [uncultured Nonlabens sp.]